jgi:hypothetical protein
MHHFVMPDNTATDLVTDLCITLFEFVRLLLHGLDEIAHGLFRFIGEIS